mmetsp:Transcript_8800/g.19011  ORF Transcript_8800/g.19011 Transcript_8800/m.19011 type:complete len:242 (-) Transcript_8800:149-874(-)
MLLILLAVLLLLIMLLLILLLLRFVSPRNRKFGNPWLVGQDLSLDAFQRNRIGNRNRGRRLLLLFRTVVVVAVHYCCCLCCGIGIRVVVFVLVVDVIADPDELPFLVGTRHQHHRHAQQIILGQLGGIGGVRLQNKLVDAHRNGSHQDFVQDLVLGGVLGAAHVQDLPLQVVVQFLKALKGDFELKGTRKACGVVQHHHVDYVDKRHDCQDWMNGLDEWIDRSIGWLVDGSIDGSIDRLVD